MRSYFNQCVHSLLLTSVPMEMPVPASMPGQLALFPNEELGKIDINSNYDLILALIDKIESGELEKTCDPEMLDAITCIIAEFARQGSLLNDPDQEEVLEQDIEELMQEVSYEQSHDYFIFPAVFYGRDKNLILCKSWFQKKCHQIGKFVRHHKKEILIGAAVVVAVAAVAVVATAVACTAASAAAGAAATFDYENSKSKEQPIAAPSSLSEIVIEQTTSFKELIVEENLLPEAHHPTFSEKTRELGAYLAHEILEGTVELALVVPEDVKSACHEKIDQIFSTKIGVRWSKELKANAVMDNFNVGIIPVPGLLAGQKKAVRVSVAEANPVRGWSVGEPVNNLTTAGTVPTWTTVRRRFWKNQAQCQPKEYSASELERMQKGLAPQRYNPKTEKLESKELHHIPPQRDGNLFKVVEVWPEEHAAIDPFRQTGK